MKLLHPPNNQKGFGHVEMFFAVVFVAIIAFVGIRILNASQASTVCDPKANLSSPCRPIIAAAVGGYTMVGSDQSSQFSFANKRLSDPSVLTNPSKSVSATTKLDVVHTYHPVGSYSLNSFETSSAKSDGVLLTNFKPSDKWSDATGNNAAVNANIKQMADSIKATSPNKVMLSVYHEPEDNVSSDANCPNVTYKGNSGTPTDYVNMWHNVRKIFDQEGVTNVVWVMNYMGYSNWDCLVTDLWPGNSYVDWVTWDNYGSGTEMFTASVKHFYDLLGSKSDSAHAFTSKPWGLNEFGYGNATGKSTQPNAAAFWNDATTSIKNNTYPRLKLYDVFDTSTNGSSQVGLDFSGSAAIAEQTAYNTFVKTVQALNGTNTGSTPTPPPPTPTTPPPTSSNAAPTVSVSKPANNATVNGTVTFGVNASDDKAVTRVVIKVDNTIVRDAGAQNEYGWGSRWDSATVNNGSHVVTATAYDAAGKTAVSKITVIVANPDKTAPSVSITSPANGASVSKIVTFGVNAADNIGITRVVLISDGGVIRDASAQNDYGWGSRWDSKTISNGTHTITATAYDAAGNSKTSSITVNVSN